MKNTSLKLWLMQKGYLSPNGPVKRFTHVCMDSGKLYIPDDAMFSFWEAIAAGFEKGERYFICETITTPIRRFYLDFDFKEPTEVGMDIMKQVVHKVNEIVNDYFGIVLSSILCSSPFKQLEEGIIKSGYHLIWPDLYLNETTSIRLCQILIGEASKLYPDITWTEDLGPYRTGMRMIGMWKMIKEKQTKREIVDKRPYTPVFKYPEDPKYFDGNWFKYLRDCSIQNLFEGISAIQPIKPIIGNDTIDEKELLYELKIEDAIRSYIRSYLPKEWDDEITKVEKKKTWYLVRTKSRYCANIKGEHNSENIYFQIYTHGFVQKCFCKCDKLEGRHFGLCKNFQSKKFPLSEVVFKILFPDKQQKQKEKLQIEKNGNTYLPNTNLTKGNLKAYLNMSINTIKSIEKKCL